MGAIYSECKIHVGRGGCYVIALAIIAVLLPVMLVATPATLHAQDEVSISREWTLNTGPGVPYSIDVSADGSVGVVAVEYPARLLVIDVGTGKLVRNVSLGDDYYASFATVAPDGSAAAVLLSRSVGKDEYAFRVVLVSLSNGKTIWTSSEYPGFGWNADFSDDGGMIAVSPGVGNVVYAFKASDGTLLWRARLPGASRVLGVGVRGDRVFASIVTSGDSGEVVVLSRDGAEVGRIKGVYGHPLLPTLSPDGKFLAVPIGLTESEGSYKGWVALYDTTTLKRVWLSPELGEYPWIATFLPSQHVVVAVLDDGKVCFLSLKDGSVLKCEIHSGWAGDSLASIPSSNLIVVTMDKKVSDEDYVGKVIAYRVSLAGGEQSSTAVPQTTAKPSTTQPTTPRTTPVTTQASTSAVTTPATTTKPSGGPPWILVAGGGVGAALAAIILALVLVKRKSRQTPTYMPPPPPPPA